MNAYHFNNGQTLRDGRPLPAIGEWLTHPGFVTPCEAGLHASEHPFDALNYAPGTTLDRVTLRGSIVPHGTDKVAASERRRDASIDARPVVLAFARWCAIQALPYWSAPETVVAFLRDGGNPAAAASASCAARYAASCAADAATYAASGAADAATYAVVAAAAAAAAAAAVAAAAAADTYAAAAAASAAASAAARQSHRDQFAAMVGEAFNGRTEWIFDVLSRSRT